jgi:glutamate--cysteine ligase
VTLTKLFEQRLKLLLSGSEWRLLQQGRIGLEKETLRVGRDGHITQTSHPQSLGAALTNPYITTDYSEAMLEFITPPLPGPQAALDFLSQVHQFVYRNVQGEMLWATSMPCVVAGESAIPIADYGPSNLGRLKYIYRRGLGYRYGRMMQVIAGVHFNYSLSEAFWPVFQQYEADSRTLQDFRSASYFALIRNLQRLGWLIPFLFGASPAVCKSFLTGGSTGLRELDTNTYYAPYATSLRMSDIGYTNRRAKNTGLAILYNSLDEYLDSLHWATTTSYPDYEKIGVVVNGEYRQLNTYILQIENEYYSSMRPKQVQRDGETPRLALKRRGVEYVELRSLDVNPFDPAGVNAPQLRFLEAFLLYCLFQISPPISFEERREIDENQLNTALLGRDRKFKLQRQGSAIELKHWVEEILDGMAGLCELLDRDRNNPDYRQALDQQKAVLSDPDLTPSARILAEMRETKEGFFQFAKRQSERHQAYFEELPMDPQQVDFLEQESLKSWQRQRLLEAQDTLSFEAYLQRYLAQSQ